MAPSLGERLHPHVGGGGEGPDGPGGTGREARERMSLC